MNIAGLNKTGKSRVAGADIELLPDFLAPDKAQQYMQELERKIDWRPGPRLLCSVRRNKIPRLHQWFADPDVIYRWSGLTMHPQPWSRELSILRQQAEQAANTRFNSVLINYYRDGNDSMGLACR